MERISKAFRDISQYPSAIGGVLIIIFLVGLSIYTIVTIPYQEAIRLWRGGQDVWYHNPPTAQPTWVNLFRRDKLPETFTINSKDIEKTVKDTAKGRQINFSMPFDYSFASFPQELTLYFNSQFSEKQPYVSITLDTPDGRNIRKGILRLNRCDEAPAREGANAWTEVLRKRGLGVGEPLHGGTLFCRTETGHQ